MVSLWMSWYQISNGYTIVSEYWLNHFDPVSGTVDTYNGYEEMGNVMLALKFFAVFWFIASLYYVLRIIADVPRTLVKEVAVGIPTIYIGAMMVIFFALMFSSAAPSQYVSGFFSTTTYGEVTYTGGPGGGFYACIFACILQSLAVVLQVYGVSVGLRTPELEPYEAPVGKAHPK